MKGKGGWWEGEGNRIKTKKRWCEEQGRQRDVRTESATENKESLAVRSRSSVLWNCGMFI